MIRKMNILWFLWIVIVGCGDGKQKVRSSVMQENLPAYKHFFISNPAYHSDGFDFPVGKPDAKGYYNAQGFGKNLHLGDDWNGRKGGNTDLGDPVYAVSHGYVYSAKEEGSGWGKVIRIIHFNDQLDKPYIESVYAHLDSMFISKDQAVKKGQQIGTMGNANGVYYAHLHLEIRDSMEMPIGGGYSNQTEGYLDPTHFINYHRTLN